VIAETTFMSRASLADVRRILVEDRARDRAKPLDRTRAEERVLRAPTIAREPMRREDLAYRERGRRSGVDDANVAASDLFDRLAQQWVVRAPEEERVDDRADDAALVEEWLDVLAHGRERLGAVGFPLLDERHELRAGLLRDVDEGSRSRSARTYAPLRTVSTVARTRPRGEPSR